MEEEYITTPELCAWLKISKAAVSNWRSEGLPHVGTPRAFRYKKSEVLKWLETRSQNSKSQK